MSELILETERLMLREFILADAEAMRKVFADAEVMRFGDGVQSEEWIAAWLQQRLDNYARSAGIGPWAMVEKSGGELIGYCGLFDYPDICGQRETEIGFRLARGFWRKGYATEAAMAVRDYAFRTLKLPRLIALIDPNNLASIRVAEKLGMHYENDAMLAGYDYPDRVYAVNH